MLAAILLLAASCSVLPAAQEPAAGQARVEWQRSLDDALALQKATGLPLLIAVNMDGEAFNDSFAGSVYKDPEFVELTRGYVCVVASLDRHSERDRDANGNRVECPRFGGCTCGEHAAIEPLLFARWFRDIRNAPRHIGVSPSGKILFDRYLDHSMETAIAAIRKHAGPRKARELPDDLGALFARRDAAARRAVEQRFHAADADGRAAILRAAAGATNEPFDLLRVALADEDDRTFALAALALAKLATVDHRPDIENALARAEDSELIATLLGRLGEFAKTDAAAARLVMHHQPLGEQQLQQPWRNTWSEVAFDASTRASVEAALDRCELQVREAPDDEQGRLALATAQAAMADVLAAEGGKGAQYWLQDAIANAEKLRDKALAAAAQAVIAVAEWRLGDAEAATKRATYALTTVHSDRRPDPWLAAALLDVVVQTAAQTAYTIAQQEPSQSLRPQLDRTLLALHLLHERGAGSESTFTVAGGLLEYAGLRRAAREQLAAAVRRFPASAVLHERWRGRLLEDLGPEGLRRQYASFVAAAPAADTATAEWFAGYAALVAAERHMRDERHEAAALAYTDAIDRLCRSAAANPEFAETAHREAVLALAGRAQLRFTAGDAEGAVADIERAAQLQPAALDETDGLLRKPRAIAGRIARGLEMQGKTELAARVRPIAQ